MKRTETIIALCRMANAAVHGIINECDELVGNTKSKHIDDALTSLNNAYGSFAKAKAEAEAEALNEETGDARARILAAFQEQEEISGPGEREYADFFRWALDEAADRLARY